MLFNPKWSDLEYSGIKLRGLIAWLETMPADKEYDYCAPTGCLAAQYLRAHGVTRARSYVHFDSPHQMPSEGLWLREIVGGMPRTFGAALERARAQAPA